MSQYCYTCMNEIREGEKCSVCENEQEVSNLPHQLKPGTILNGKYLVGKCIGEGGFGITYIGRDLILDIRVAIKECYPSGHVSRGNASEQTVIATTEKQRDFFERGKERFLQEARNIAKFTGEAGIVEVREYFEVNNTAYIIMEYLDGQNLSAYMEKNGRFSTEEIFQLMLPIANSLDKIHQEGIIHRDISPDNIMLLKNGTLKLTDFGSARFFMNTEKEMSIFIKHGYAPEEQHRSNGEQGPWTDVYGLCATMYSCITGVVPPNALDRMIKDEFIWPSQLNVEISEGCETVLKRGLAVFKTNRCKDMQELAKLMQDALANKEIPEKKGVHLDVYKTQYADEPIAVEKVEEQPKPTQKPVKSKSGQSGKNLLVAILIMLGILGALGVGIASTVIVGYVVLNERGDDEEPEKEELPTATEFIEVTATSKLNDQYQYNYNPENILKKDDTCWCEGVDGYGINQTITLKLPEEQKLYGLEIQNGYVGTERQYTRNAKIKDVMIEFSDGRSLKVTLKSLSVEQRGNVQLVKFKTPVETSWVKLTIKSVYESECEDTCLTYVAPYIGEE